MCPECGEQSHHGCREASSIEPKEENANYSRALISERSPQLLSSSAISEISSPNFVYMRRKLKRNSAGILSAPLPASVEKFAEESLSVISSDAPSVAVKEQHVFAPDERKTEGAGTPVLCYQEFNRKANNLKSESFNACLFIEELSSDEVSKSSKQKFVEVESINDSCSSSKSNMELVSASSMKAAEPDDTCECSSSSVMIPEVVGADTSEKDLCVSILRSQRLIRTVFSGRTIASAELDDAGNTSTSRSCKICTLVESAQKMLVCDNCEDAFHVSCCNPRVKRIPIDEWFCHSCLKKRKISEAVSWSSPNIMGEMSRYKNDSAARESSPIAFMLSDNGPYTTGVRVGKGFQADVPDWSGPINNDFDTIGEPLEMDPSEFVGLHELKFKKPSKCCGPIGNWLQCREAIDDVGDGVGGTTCGKWRRAPLFEVQTDDWACCCAVIWDPIHADCAVPQEVETDEALKQLKYIQVLRPRIAAKSKKLECSIIGISLKNAERRGYKSRGTRR